MEAKDIEGLIGKEAWWVPKEKYVDIVSYEKGWVTVKSDEEIDGKTEHKVRAKDLVLMDTDETFVENEEGEVELKKEDPSLPSLQADSVSGDVTCGCGLTFEPPRVECFQCPDCGRWHRVRLHPNMENYVKGMGETPSGRDTVDIDDHVANILRGMDLDELYGKICEELGKLDPEAAFSKAMDKDFKASKLSCTDYLAVRYQNLNPGMQRMNLGNLLRGAMKRQEIINDRPKKKGIVQTEAPVTDELSAENKVWIDSASFEDLMRRHRFAPVGDPMFLGATGVYYGKAMAERKASISEEEAVAISKKIGWNK